MHRWVDGRCCDCIGPYYMFRGGCRGEVMAVVGVVGSWLGLCEEIEVEILIVCLAIEGVLPWGRRGEMARWCGVVCCDMLRA